MKKTIIITLVVIVAILGLAVAIKINQKPTDTNNQKTEENTGNPASDIKAPEIRITPENFDSEVRNYKGVIMVDFYLPSCSHCQKMGPIITDVAKEVEGKYKVGKINAQIADALSIEYKIQSVPAMIFYKDGKEIDRIIGETSKAEILAKFEEVAK